MMRGLVQHNNYKNYVKGDVTIGGKTKSRFTTPSQPGLKDSSKHGSEKRRKSFWVLDQKTLEHRGIRIPNDKNMFFTPTKHNYSK